MLDAFAAPRCFILCGSVVALAMAAGCSSAPQPPPPIKVGTLALTPHSLPVEQSLPGRTVAYEVSDVRPQVNGLLRQRLFTEGQEVQAGQVLYQIDPAPYQAAYDTARGQLAQAQAAVVAARPKAARYRTLVEQDAASKQDADDAQAALQEAEANVVAAQASLQAARINLDYTRVTAPISGTIGSSAYTAGALVTAQQDAALAKIQRLDPIYLDVSQSSTQMLALRERLDAGQIKAADGKISVRVRLEDGSFYPHPGTLEFVGTSVDPGTGGVTLRVVVPNPQHLLLPGMYLRALLPLASDPNAILVPQQAVTRDAKGDPLVKLLGAHNRVEERRIRTGDAVGHDWVVQAGLKPGERLIVVNGSRAEIGKPVVPYAVSAAQLEAAPAVPGDAQAD
ncbi:efflux RND transporter periplasmic adaptor subunit [Xanthomonas sp. CFBP 8703]|jgi:multidrug efflux system membrane fusion protein|uniref:Efflux RND transporter periplasmic adaptor subunit n=2 Tax=Xanthomonas TaxID=338 RepID=A0ABS3BAN0_9XANT|nr:efflux RND transporter periplasmic adaptor subunit [Xanthomonas bonasiae]MBN6113386.1 efflux RND transporter periplasmic adaptor subunit [Xanthomonas bonasiae]NYF22851.1 multidrug efflux system membrane fusion protein [Xanthomonas sp. JAI131]